MFMATTVFAVNTPLKVSAEVVTKLGITPLKDGPSFAQVVPGMVKTVGENDSGRGEVLVYSVPGASVEVYASTSATGGPTAILTIEGAIPTDKLDVTDITLYSTSGEIATGESLHLVLPESGEETIYVGGTLAVQQGTVTAGVYSKDLYIVAQH